MDPSIMKLLEEDEDETMHSGADVEAFTAALNRDIEGDNTSTSQPSDSDSAALSKGIYHTSSQLFPQWHTSSQDETANSQSQQNLNGSQQQAQHSSEMDLKQHGSGPENQRQQIDNQLLDDRRQRQAEQNTVHFSRPSGIHNSEKNPELPKINQHAAATEQKPGNPRGQVPFGLLLPLLTPQLDKDRSMQLQTVFNKLKKNEISKDIFVHNMRSIVGDQMLKIAVYKLHAQGKQARNSQTGPNQLSLQSQASAQEQHQKMQTVGPHQGNVPQSFAQLHQKGGTGDMSHIPSSASQLKSDSANLTMGKKPSFPIYGSAGNNYHPFSGSNVNASAASLKQQPHDSQMRQASVHQSIDANQNLVHWQSSTGQEQKNGAQSSMAYVKQEPVDQGNEQQYKSLLSSPRGLSSFSPSQAHGNAMTGTLKDDALEMQSARIGFSGITSTVPSNTASSSMTAQLDPNNPNNSLSSRIPSALAPVGPGNNAKTPPKRPPIGQKKPLESLGSSPPLSSKKQKVSGTFADQSIDQLNDVTAVSGVNLREEEEQLLSGPKDESRVSEASRRVMQEEEERLILQKIPLQKKLAEIMSKCGVKSSSNDVERCLSLCVEERMRGLISNLIRLSKQRVDIEKPRHQTIVTSDVRKQILAINQKAREEWEKKQSEAEKLQKLNELDGDAGVDGDKERDDGRVKTLKANKDEDDKMRATAANVAARAAVGGDDMLSKWQLMAEQARQKREGGGVDVASGSQPGKEMSFKPSSTSAKNARDIEGGEKRVPSAGSLAFGSSRKLARNQVVVPQTKATPSISIKDVIAVLEREPQMSKSTVMYRLYEKMHGDSVAE